jgi:hypothetical protein
MKNDNIIISVADTDPFDTDPDPVFYFGKDPILTVSKR